MQISLGDVIGWAITIASAVGIAVTVSVKVSISNKSRKENNIRKYNQHNINTGNGGFIGGDKNA